jgi:hypothetical protein
MEANFVLHKFIKKKNYNTLKTQHGIKIQVLHFVKAYEKNHTV